MHSIKKALMSEMEEFEERIRKNPEQKIPDAQLNRVHMVSDTIKNICKIKMLEDGGMSEYSQRGYSRDGGGGSYGGDSYGRSYDGGSNRGYSRDGGGSNSYDGGSSERRDRMGRYSRAGGGKEEMMEQLGRMMHEAEDDRQKEAIEKCLRELDRM